jgi:hypothetical protein
MLVFRPAHRLCRFFVAALLGCALTAASTVVPAAAVAVEPPGAPPGSAPATTAAPSGAFTIVQLKNLVHDRIGPWKQVTLDVPLERQAMPRLAQVVYGFHSGKQKVTLSIQDVGAINSAPGPSHWTGPPNRRETSSGSELVYNEGGHTVREIERRQPPAREVVVLLANGIQITVVGDVDMKRLKDLATSLIRAAAALVRPVK